MLFIPVLAYFVILVATGLDRSYVFFASYGILVVLIFCITWMLRRA